MLSKIALSIMAVCVFTVPAFAGDKCAKGDFVGTYTFADLNRDVFGDGSVFHSYASQLTLHSDGTVELFFTGFPDYVMTIGTGVPNIGSWTCRADDKLVVNVIQAVYAPEIVNGVNDVVLQYNSRDTYLFTITDANTLTRIQFRSRRYTPTQDLTDPNAGTLRPLNTNIRVYKRLIASDADLLVP
jgi:hypothetical protein